MEVAEGHKSKSSVTTSAEGAIVAPVPPGTVPVTRTETVGQGEDRWLGGRGLANAAEVEAASPRRVIGILPSQEPVSATEGVATGELEPAQPARVPVNRLRGEEVDLAGPNPANPNWFWELLEEAGWDVW